VPELVLGTAQWGSSYGITNTHGRVDDDDLVVMVAEAERSGVTAMDTALAYGDAQARLAPYSDRFWISTKVSGAGDVAEQVGTCLEQLQVTSLDAVMLHDWDVLDDAKRILAVGALGELSREGLISRVGVSAYEASGIESAVEVFTTTDADLGILQVPANALDRRLDTCPALVEVAALGCIVQVRSVFLQGLLASRYGGELGAHPDLVEYLTWGSAQPGGLVGAAINHVRALKWVSQVVVGVTTPDEWLQVRVAWRETRPRCAPAKLASEDSVLLDPRLW
jgi:aryl-alcohol dehydrogenase-like predicted oxidoreductase